MLKFIGINKEKEYVCQTRNTYVAQTRKYKYGCKCKVHMHSTAELKAYWLSCYIPFVRFHCLLCNVLAKETLLVEGFANWTDQNS